MPFVVVDNTLQIEIRYLVDGQRCENTLYARYPAPPTPTDAENLADAVYDWWVAEMAPITNQIVGLSEIYITDLTEFDSFTHTRVSSPVEPGEVAFPPLPNNVSFVVTFRTNKRGRSFRGRNYFVGLSEPDVNGNVVTGGFATALQAAYVALNTAIDGLGADWVVVSRFHASEPRPAGVTTPITSVAIIDGVVDSQRRRLPGRGT